MDAYAQDQDKEPKDLCSDDKNSDAYGLGGVS
jgi:hypothetical protein